MYKMKNNMMPAHFGQMFTSASEIHNYPTKFAERNSLYVHVIKEEKGLLDILGGYGILC